MSSFCFKGTKTLTTDSVTLKSKKRGAQMETEAAERMARFIPAIVKDLDNGPKVL